MGNQAKKVLSQLQSVLWVFKKQILIHIMGEQKHWIIFMYAFQQGV